MAERDYYADLNITQYATNTQIKMAFHALAKQHHPDKSGSNDTSDFRRAREAYEKLTDSTTRKEYDRTYQHKRAYYQTAEGPTYTSKPTRTAAYEAEEAEREFRQNRPTRPQPRPRPYSPPPTKPSRKFNEPSYTYYTGKAYTAWEKRDTAYRSRHPEYEQNLPPPPTSSSAHGLQVQMSSHPSTTQRCTLRTQNWSVQLAGSDICVFCLTSTTSCSRCPGCEALACRTCLRQIIEKERSSGFAGFNSKTQYWASGG
ncbi:DnaJ-domain-containing protein [Ophiobolus disseminans]|uniref:DnaJ-domain-containing protein n=1 Tax=Ophiobolus disseminans TaxID=1469910 RepID=A0A6A7A454_9PLEO|nr:DnaJ-domain-containing protein [Ophiobolus disseminans]